jgi:hypothetical protein
VASCEGRLGGGAGDTKISAYISSHYFHVTYLMNVRGVLLEAPPLFSPIARVASAAEASRVTKYDSLDNCHNVIWKRDRKLARENPLNSLGCI